MPRSRIPMPCCVIGRPPQEAQAMTRWHETITANIGLRVGGIVLLILARVQAWRLHHIVQMNFSGQATPLLILLAAMTFLSASIGCALLFVGPGLWRRV